MRFQLSHIVGCRGGGLTISDINKDMLDVGRERYSERYADAGD